MIPGPWYVGHCVSKPEYWQRYLTMRLEDDDQVSLRLNGVEMELSGKGRMFDMEEGDELGWGGKRLKCVRVDGCLTLEGDQKTLNSIGREE